MASTWAPQDGEEREIRHDDDGFTYKIVKRQRLTDSSKAVSQVALTDSEAEEKQRRERKRNTLLKLKKQYQDEIQMWEILSNEMRSMQERTNEVDQALSYLVGYSDSSESFVDKLLFEEVQVDAIILYMSNLCDEAEAICDEAAASKMPSSSKQATASSRELMKSLCDRVSVCLGWLNGLVKFMLT